MKFGKREAIYLACYAACIVTMYVFGEIYNKPRALWLVLSLLTVCIYATIAIRSKLSRSNLVFRFVVIALFTIAAIISNKPQMMIYAALICTADLTSFRRIVLVCFVTCGVMIILTPIADIVGIVPKRVFHRGGVIAHSFGFGYYNTVPYTFFFMVLEFFFLKATRHKKANWFELIVLFGINYSLYKLSTLRLVFYLICIVIGLYIILVKFNIVRLNSRLIKPLCISIFIFLFFFTLWLYYSYTDANNLFVRVNNILSERLSLGKLALERYPINLFGHNIVTVKNTSDYFYVDSGFLFSLLGYGLLFTGMAMAFYTYLCRRAAIENNKVLFIWLFSVAAFSVINNTWISLYINPILLYVPILIKEKKFGHNKLIDDLLAI